MKGIQQHFCSVLVVILFILHSANLFGQVDSVTDVVDLSGEPLSTFPMHVLENTELQKLVLNETHLSSLPEGIGVLKALKSLEFNHLDQPNLEFKQPDILLTNRKDANHWIK